LHRYAVATQSGGYLYLVKVGGCTKRLVLLAVRLVQLVCLD
jgi:hypothetical protein